MTSRPVRPSLFAFLAVSAVLFAPPLEAGAVKKARKKLKAFAADRLAALHAEDSLAIEELRLTLDLLALKLALGSVDGADAAAQAASAAAAFDRGLEDRAGAALADVEAFAAEQVAALGSTPKDWRLAGGGLWDAILADVDDEVRWAWTKGRKRLSAFTADVETVGSGRLLVVLLPAAGPAPTAPGAGSAEVPLRSVRILAAAAWSDGKDGPSSVSVVGLADAAAAGGAVEVTLSGAGGPDAVVSGSVGPDGTFAVRFPQEGAPAPGAGNYRVVARQGEVEHAAAVSVP